MFDAYGLRAGSNTSTDPYSYFGGQWGYYTDSETGLQLLTHRYYDPATGRFVTRDLIGYDGGLNLYAYALENPIMGIDPSGLWDFDVEYFRRSMLPDYAALNIGIIGKKLFGVQGQVVIDRYGNFYYTPPGFAVGTKGFGISGTVGWLTRQRGVPNEADLRNWLKGLSVNANVIKGIGPGLTLSNGNHGWQAAGEIGIGNNQGGVNAVWDILAKKIPKFAWDYDNSNDYALLTKRVGVKARNHLNHTNRFKLLNPCL